MLRQRPVEKDACILSMDLQQSIGPGQQMSIIFLCVLTKYMSYKLAGFSLATACGRTYLIEIKE